MKIPIFIILTFIMASDNLIYGQVDSLPRLSLSKIAHVNQEDTYITFPGDIGNLEPLIFEANINPNFVIRQREDSRAMAVLTPQFRIRMLDQHSYPIKTPSYIPQVSFYYLLGSKELTRHTTLFFRIAHHSNGQDGSFYVKPDEEEKILNGKNKTPVGSLLDWRLKQESNPQNDMTKEREINLETGNFSTNFLELGFIDTEVI